MLQELTRLTYKGNVVRTVEQDGAIWWVLVDVCKVLGIVRGARTVERLDEDEVRQAYLTDTTGRKQQMYIINESGLYSVLLRSDKPEAKPFKRWVTHEVLPSIRRTGQYKAPSVPAKPKNLVCDVPDNTEAQKIMQEMRELLAAVGVLLNHYNTYRAEEQRRDLASMICEVCGRLYTKSSDLDRVKYKQIEKQ